MNDYLNKDLTNNLKIHVIHDLKMDEDYVNDIMHQNGYLPLDTVKSLRNIKDQSYLISKFSCHDNVGIINQLPLENCHMVTGFGPTNSPTCGTLSLLLRTISLQQELGIETSIIISNLGAWNSRNIDYKVINYYTKKFLDFIPHLGFDLSNGELRTHEDFDNLIVAGIIAKVLKIRDFNENQEATKDVYQALGIQGSDYGTMLDSNYTVADILKPAFVKQKNRILVVAGIEEHHFTKLSKLVVQRLNYFYPGIFLPPDIQVSALYARLIKGLHPYPKMSKSIPESSINIGDPMSDIERKILNCVHHDEFVIFQMINLVSDWDVGELQRARAAFEGRLENPQLWREEKQKYLNYFLGIKKIWDSIPEYGCVSRFL